MALLERLLCAGGGGNAPTPCLLETKAFKYCRFCSASRVNRRSASYLCVSVSKEMGIELGGRWEALMLPPATGFLAVEESC